MTFKSTLLIATLLITASNAYAANTKTFTLNDPAGVLVMQQTGNLNTISGSLTGEGNKVTLKQIGTSNTTTINSNLPGDPSQQTNFSTIGSTLNGVGNQSTITFHPFSSVESYSSLNKIRETVTGNANVINTLVSYDENIVTTTLKGNGNNVKNELFRGEAVRTVVTGNDNKVYNYNADRAFGTIPAGTVNGTITGDRNDVRTFASFTSSGPTKNTVYTIKGNDNNLNVAGGTFTQTGNNNKILSSMQGSYETGRGASITQTGDNNQSTIVLNTNSAQPIVASNYARHAITGNGNVTSTTYVPVFLGGTTPRVVTDNSENTVILGNNNKVTSSVSSNENVYSQKIEGDNNTVANTQTFTSGLTSALLIDGNSNKITNNVTGNLLSPSEFKINEKIYGNGNTATLSVSSHSVGSDSRANMTMTGDNNLVDVTTKGGQSMLVGAVVSGLKNTMTLVQNANVTTNSADTLSANMTGNNNVMSATQTGNSDYMRLFVVAGDANTTNASQTGDGHSMTSAITGNGNQLNLAQDGNFHTMQMVVTGNTNVLNGTQKQFSNIMRGTITGNNNNLTMVQETSGNTMNVKLTGDNNFATFKQIGIPRTLNFTHIGNNLGAGMPGGYTVIQQ